LNYASVYDAVNAISRAHPLYGISLSAPQDASRRAAAAVAAHDVLTALYPAQKTNLDHQLAADLAGIPAGPAKQAGIQAGAQAPATSSPCARTTARTPPRRPTPPPANPATIGRPHPDFKAPEFTHWGNVTPFLLHTGHQFRG
jgi:hypothetical protein